MDSMGAAPPSATPMAMPATAAQSPAARRPCCPTQVETGRAGRCARLATQGNGKSKCATLRPDECPVACGACSVCRGHPKFEYYANTLGARGALA